jgi:hypothetical protein
LARIGGVLDIRVVLDRQITELFDYGDTIAQNAKSRPARHRWRLELGDAGLGVGGVPVSVDLDLKLRRRRE